MKFTALLLIIILGSTLKASATPECVDQLKLHKTFSYRGNISDEMVTELQTQVEDKLGFQVTLKVNEEPTSYRHSIYVLRGDEKLAYFEFQYLYPIGKYEGIDKNGISIQEFQIYNVNHRAKGISELVFAKLLNVHPNINRVDTEFQKTNEKIVLDGMKSGLSLLDAVKATPAYKMRTKFGFTNITHLTGPPKIIVLGTTREPIFY